MTSTRISIWEFIGGLSGAVIGLVVSRELGNGLITIVASIAAAAIGWIIASYAVKRFK